MVKKKTKVVIDTNVFVSSVLFGGRLEVIIDSWKTGTFDYLLSGDLLNEYIRVLHYSKFNLETDEIKKIINEDLLPYVHPVITHSKNRVVKNDASDDKLFNLALDGNAGIIVSGDKHILAIKKYKEISVVDASSFVKYLEDRRSEKPEDG